MNDLVVIIETCDAGHRYAKFPNHPKRDGMERCPYCMSIGLDSARETIQELERSNSAKRFILERAAIELRGLPDALQEWGWADIPERIAALKAKVK